MTITTVFILRELCSGIAKTEIHVCLAKQTIDPLDFAIAETTGSQSPVDHK